MTSGEVFFARKGSVNFLQGDSLCRDVKKSLFSGTWFFLEIACFRWDEIQRKYRKKFMTKPMTFEEHWNLWIQATTNLKAWLLIAAQTGFTFIRCVNGSVTADRSLVFKLWLAEILAKEKHVYEALWFCFWYLPFSLLKMNLCSYAASVKINSSPYHLIVDCGGIELVP